MADKDYIRLCKKIDLGWNQYKAAKKECYGYEEYMRPIRIAWFRKHWNEWWFPLMQKWEQNKRNSITWSEEYEIVKKEMEMKIHND